MALAAVIALVGCAPSQGWQRTGLRTCASAGPPRVCVDADPDRPLRFTVGGAALVPGECVDAPRARGGQVRIAVADGRSGAQAARWIRAPRGRVTRVEVRAGEVRIRPGGRTRCDQAPAIDE